MNNYTYLTRHNFLKKYLNWHLPTKSHFTPPAPPTPLWRHSQEELVAHSWIFPSFFVSFLTLDLYQFCFPILYLHTCLSQLKSFKAVTRISYLCVFFTTHSYVICWVKAEMNYLRFFSWDIWTILSYLQLNDLRSQSKHAPTYPISFKTFQNCPI